MIERSNKNGCRTERYLASSHRTSQAPLMTAPRPSVTHIRADHVPQAALNDLWEGLRRYDMWSRFAMHEIRQRFRRSLLGPLWLTASMGVFVAALGFVMSTIFQQELAQTLPYIATGVIFWGLITSSITEGSTVFITNEGYIRNVPMPLSVHLYQMLARNVIIWFFNMVIYLGVIVFFGIAPGWNVLIFFIALPLLLLNIAWMALAAGILSARYRDVPLVIASLIQVLFFMTPIFWSAEMLPSRPAFVVANPVYHLLEIVRQPLLGNAPGALSWGVVAGMAVVGWGFTAWLYRRAQPRIPYWV